MSTQSAIIAVQPDGSYKGVSVHYDGYLAGVGDKLKENYRDNDKVQLMMSLGNMNNMEERLIPTIATHKYDYTVRPDPREPGTTVFLGRDDPMEDPEDHVAVHKPTLAEVMEALDWVAYVYLWDKTPEGFDWYVQNVYGNRKFVELASAKEDDL